MKILENILQEWLAIVLNQFQVNSYVNIESFQFYTI